MKLTKTGIKDSLPWELAGIALPKYDVDATAEKTLRRPAWVHFGAGNIFRGFIAGLQQSLLDAGLSETGIIAAETYDGEIIRKIYEPYGNLSLQVLMQPDGTLKKTVIGSLANGLFADSSNPEDWNTLQDLFRSLSLQMASFTITEKGYSLRGLNGELLPIVKSDMEAGPDKPKHAMAVVASLAYVRYCAGKLPLAFLSMDNCSHNGEKLHGSVLEIVRAWEKNGFVPAAFCDYLENPEKITFPWSMIDKITPRPSEEVEQSLERDGVEEMAPIVTDKKTFIAPFVNAEVPQYLVIEDSFPNGRPCLEKAGVYFTDRLTVEKTERMKVTTCLNPLHTALAVFGCLLGYQSIAEEMKDPQLSLLVQKIGYDEGMPVVVDPGIIRPKDFIDEVIERRLPNRFIPDTPQRIATDTSQKIAIRFGETIKSYLGRADLNAANLVYIPLVLAGWLRYLLGVNDEGDPMEISADPMLSSMRSALSGITVGKPDFCKNQLEPVLKNEVLFGVDLVEIGLGEKVTEDFQNMIVGTHAVRHTLAKLLDA
jgi:fructuronate reductase